MEWYAWVAWGVAIATGAAGTWLGIRAERRASKYLPHWAIDVQKGSLVHLINRTGEDAEQVTVEITGGSTNLSGPVPLVTPDTFAAFRISPDGGAPGDFTASLVVSWTRRTTGRRYTWSPRKPLGLRRARQQAIVW